MNLQVNPKPYTLIESLHIPLKGPLKNAYRLQVALQGPRSSAAAPLDPLQKLRKNARKPRKLVDRGPVPEGSIGRPEL